ncbi:hypothetical protein [Streptomyces sp. KN37]|uniref:hypothetical protein n=1 Tax=Streptomyces sp. KN37 TaxID=3090667 RepID=UPI002A7573EF|nr:hypothetical protein [Streptomyces sp. KN37]WPO74197.1 hypothetical protein R9806_28085 [Streptomyces sp. KN37]
MVAVACLAAVGIGRAFWPSPEGGGPAPRPAAPVKELPVVVDSAEPELIGTDLGRSAMGLPPPPGSDASLTEKVLVEDVTGGGAWTVQFIDYHVFPPDSGVLPAKAVQGRFWDQYRKDAKELRCDKMPPLKRVALGAGTGYRCQYLDVDGDAPRWVNAKVFLEEVGPVFREIE